METPRRKVEIEAIGPRFKVRVFNDGRLWQYAKVDTIEHALKLSGAFLAHGRSLFSTARP